MPGYGRIVCVSLSKIRENREKGMTAARTGRSMPEKDYCEREELTCNKNNDLEYDDCLFMGISGRLDG